MSDDFKLTITDCRNAGYCVSGVKRRFKDLGLDFRKLLDDGIPVSELQGIPDASLQRAIEFAKRRALNGR